MARARRIISGFGGTLALLLGGALMLPGAASAVAPGPEPVEKTGRAVVLLDRSAAAGPAARSAIERSLRRSLAGSSARPGSVIPDLDLAPVALKGESVRSVRRRLARTPGVRAVEPEYVRFPRLVPSDPLYGAPDFGAPGGDQFQWFLRDQGFERAWDRSDGSGAVVAVIDSGIDKTNEDLGPQLVRAKKFGRFIGRGTSDLNGHGTHVAGLACAQSGNAYGGASAGFDCDLIFEKTDLTDVNIAKAIRDAARHGADVINMSFGGPRRSKAVRRALRFARKRDVVLVAAASNANTKRQGFPAQELQPQGTGPELKKSKGLVVTAAGANGRRAFYKPGRGSGISLAAIGAGIGTGSRFQEGVFSNFPRKDVAIDTGSIFAPPCECRRTVDDDRRFAYLAGTSQATPQVAGAIALIRSARPRLSNRRIVRLIKESASRSSHSRRLGWGLLDADAALSAAGV